MKSDCLVDAAVRRADGKRRTRENATTCFLLVLAVLLSACSQQEDEGLAGAQMAEDSSWEPQVRSKPVAAAPDQKQPDQSKSPPAVAGAATASARVKELAAAIAADLAQRCPTADPADQAAFNACRKAMFGPSKMRASLSPVTFWGRQNKDPEKSLHETNLTQFAPDVLTGMYLPLFMYTGRYEVTWQAKEKLYRIELGARFRNRMPPGQFPYPFWHEDEKWKTYEDANAIWLWVDPQKITIRNAQFSKRGTVEPPTKTVPVTTPTFDGKWMWKDASGTLQPKVTLFDGLFRNDNPYLKQLDGSYRELAISLRQGQCMSCHVPNNPNGMRRLVLLQTPAHAAAEIKRVLKAVRRGSMPIDKTTGIEEPLKGEIKGDLLQRAEAFEKLIDAAKAWEASAGKATPPSATPKPRPSQKSARLEP